MRENTPPASPHHSGGNELYDEDGNEMVYVGDLDEVLEEIDNEEFDEETADDGDGMLFICLI